MRANVVSMTLQILGQFRMTFLSSQIAAEALGDGEIVVDEEEKVVSAHAHVHMQSAQA